MAVEPAEHGMESSITAPFTSSSGKVSGLPTVSAPLANGRTNPGPPEDPRENRGRGGLWKAPPPPWEPAAKPARSHGGLEAFGSHTPHSLDGGIAYKPLTRGLGWVLLTLSKQCGIAAQ